MANRKKFVLVDPSFEGKDGHNWQYALAFLDAARANNFDFVLLANKKSPLLSDYASNIKQKNIFEYSFYMHGDVASRHSTSRLRLRLRSFDIQSNRRIEELNAQIREYQDHGNHLLSEHLTARRDELLDSLLAKRDAMQAEIEREEPVAEPFNRDDFAMAMAREIASLELGKGDVILFHTATQGMLESLSEISLHLDGPIDIDAYFFFHFGAGAPDARTFVDRYHSYSSMETLKLRLATGSPFQRLHLLATSPQLRDELEGLIALPVGLFDDIRAKFDRYVGAIGGVQRYLEMREEVVQCALEKRFILGVRTSDLDAERVKQIEAAALSLAAAGFEVKVRVAYHADNRAKATEYITDVNQKIFSLVDTSDYDNYLKFLATSSIAILPYCQDIYKKRVSGVLHDCAILGVSCVVPSGTPLEDTSEYVDVHVYKDLASMPGVVSHSVRAIHDDPKRSEARVEEARRRITSDPIKRLQNSMTRPSLTVMKRGPVATVVTPLWGRVGSSCVIEAQVRFLLEQGYFVVHVLASDKATQLPQGISYFWRMLFENSMKMRANIQRIAHRDKDVEVDTLPFDANGFDYYLENIGANLLRDDQVEKLTKQSVITIVNHIFNSRLARRIGGGKFVLESHDIQSRQMVHWPLKNPITMESEPYYRLLNAELKEIEKFDYVVNISLSEHRQLSLVNAKSRVITPYIPAARGVQQYESIGAMSYNYEWDARFRHIYKFDFLLMGDSHPANIESAIWFLEKVFLPYFERQQFTLGIVGRVCERLKARFGDRMNIYYCGFVDDIADVRNLSRIVILPDQRGSGISIKTLETLAFGWPFVATGLAFRGISEFLETPPPCIEEPGDFAARMSELATDERKRKAAGKIAAEIYLSVADKPVYDAAWTEVLNRLGLVACQGAVEEDAPSLRQASPCDDRVIDEI